MKSKPFPLFAVVRNTLLASLTLCGVGQAADQTWLSANANNNWSTSDSNWLGAVAWTQGNNAIFGGTGETVTLTEGISVGDITFTSGGYTIAGNTLTLGSSTIATGNNNATISSVLAGTSLTKTGSGTLTLSGVNTLTGTVNANAGTLTSSAASTATGSFLGGPGTSGSRRTVNIASGAQVSYTSATANSFLNLTGAAATGGYGSFHDFNISGTVAINDGGGVSQILQSTYNLSNGGVITNTGTANNGTWGLLFGFNAAGSGNINVTGTGNQITADRIGFFNGATVTTNAGADLTISSIIGQSGGVSALTKAGAGTLILTGANTYTGTTTISAGLLQFAASASQTLAGSVSGAGALTQSGNSMLTLSNATVNYAGMTTVTRGVLNLTNATASSSNTWNIGVDYGASAPAATGLLMFNKSLSLTGKTLSTFTAAGTPASTTAFLNPLLALQSGNTGSPTVTAPSDPNQAIVRLGNTYFLTHASQNSYVWSNAASGTATDGAGTWDAATTASWRTTSASPGANVNWGGGAKIANFGVANGTAGTVTVNGTVSAGGLTFNPATSGTYTVANGTSGLIDFGANNGVISTNGADATISASLMGSNGLNKQGPGVLTLSGANTVSGSLLVNAGAVTLGNSNTFTGVNFNGTNLVLGHASALGTGTLTINGGRLDSSAANLVNAGNNAQVWNGDFTFTGTQSLDLGTGAVSLGTAAGTTRTITTTANTLTIGGAISNGTTATGLTKAGGGTLVLSGADSNTITGPLNVYQGAVTLAKTGGAKALGGDLTFDNILSPDVYGTADNQFSPGAVVSYVSDSGDHGRFDLMGTTQTVAGVQMVGYASLRGVIQNSEAIPNSGSSTLVLNGSGNYTFTGYLRNQTGTLALTKSGSGTQTLVGTEIRYSGATQVSGGRLVLQDTTNFGSAITNSSEVEFNSPTGSQIKGTLAGAGTWYKTGAGITQFNTAGQVINASGQFFIQQGTVQNNGNSVNWSGSTLDVDISSGAILDLYADPVYVDQLTGTGIVQNNFGNNAGAQSGASAFIEKFVVGTANGSSTFGGVIRNNATNATLAASTGNGGLQLEKAGAGTLTLTGSNLYTGLTLINGGSLVLGGASGALGNTAITVGAGTTLKLDNTGAANSGARLSDSTALTLTGGTLQFANDAAGVSFSETVGVVSASLGGTITTSQAAPGQTSTLTLGGLTGSANFSGTGLGAADGRNKILITNQANGSVVGTFNSTGVAVYDTTLGVTAAALSDIPFGGTINDSPSTNIRLAGGSSGNVLLGGIAGTTITVNSILQNQTSATVIETDLKTLRLGAGGGILLPSGMASLTIGTTANAGTLTAGGADNTPGTLNLTNNDGTALLTINSAIANNGASGAVGVVTGGAGKVVLAGTNTYTGTTYLGATTTEFSGGTQTLAGNISGQGALLKTNAAGTLILAGTNSYTGGTTITGGTLQLGNGTATTNSTMTGTYTLGSLGTLRWLRYNDVVAPTWANVLGSGVFSVMTNRANSGITNDWGTATLGSGFTGTLQIERGRVVTNTQTSLGNATAVVVLDGGHLGMWQGGTFGQNFTIAGTGYGEVGYQSALRLANAGITTTVNGTVALSGNATLAASGTGILNNEISGAFDLTYGTSNQAGKVLLNGTNTHTGFTTIAFGTLQFGKPVSFYNANQPSWSKLVVNSGTTAAFSVGGTGEFTSLDIDTVKGLTNIAAGVPATTGFKNGAILGLDTTNANLANFAYTSIIGDHVAGATTDTLGLAKLGTGTLTLNSANTYTGATRIVAGVLSVGTVANAGTPSDIGAASNVAANLVFAGGNLQYTGATASTNRSFTLSAAGSIEVTNAATILTIANTVAAAGNSNILTKNGNGVLVLGGSADNSSMFFAVSTGEARLEKSANGVRAAAGITSVAAGATVKLTGTGTDQIYGGSAAANYGLNGLAGTLDLNGHSESTSNFNGTSAGVLTNSASATNVTWTVGETDATSSFAGIIQNGAGTVALTKIGINTQTLSGASTYSGGSVIRAGTLQLDGVSAAGSGLITLGDGSTGTSTTRLLANVGSGTFANDITVSANGTGTATLEQSQNLSQLSGLITLNRATTITHSNNDRAGISGKITGNVGTLTFTGGRTTLDNTVASDFSGNIVVNTGALQTNGMVNCLPAAASLTINGTSIFQLNNGFAQTINALNGGTAATTGVQIIAGAATSLTIGAGGGNGNFVGKIVNNANTLSIIKTGVGTQEFSSANTYSGGTTIRNGALVLTGGNDRLLPTGSVTLGDVATSGKLVLGNSTAASNQTFAGIATTGLGGSVVGANAATDSVLTLSIASSATFGGSLGGAGSNENKLALTKTGAGSLTLNGASTYSGGTTVQTGSLILGNTSGSGTGSGAVAMQTGTTLGGTGSASGATTIASGAIVAPGTNIGTLTLGSATLAGTYQCQLNGTTGDRLTVTGALTVSPGAAITVSTLAAPTASSFTILSYGSLTGTLPTITPPSGYTVDTNTPGQVKLVKTGSYSAWASTNAPTGTPTSDYDGDGVSNALEWVLGGLASTKDLAKLPAVSTSGGNLIFTFVRNDAAWQSGDTTVQIETGTTLANWPAVYNVGVDTASSSAGVTVTNNGSTDTITLTVPQAPDAKKFARLKVTVATP